MTVNTSEFTVSKNTSVFVEQATADQSAAQIDEIERRAKARVVEAREESARIDTQESNFSGNGIGSEGKVYADLAMEALGLKLVSSVTDFIGTRMSDKDQDDQGAQDTKRSRTMKEIFKVQSTVHLVFIARNL